MGSERIAGGHTILFVPKLPAEDGIQHIVGGIDTTATVDIVVGQGGEVLKDRHGDAAEVLTRLRAGLATRELSEEATPPSLLGAPLAEIAALTLDGAHWLEVFGTLRRSAPLGGPVLRFQVAQAPGGKGRKLGISQGDTIAVREDAVRGVQRKGGEPLAPIPEASS